MLALHPHQSILEERFTQLHQQVTHVARCVVRWIFVNSCASQHSNTRDLLRTRNQKPPECTCGCLRSVGAWVGV
jgi:hypothetical protein